MTDFEKQKKIFSEFIENTQDRFDLIIKDGVNIIFDVNSITFDNKIMLRYTFKTLIPEIILLDSLKTKEDILVMKNVIEYYDELSYLLKYYITIFNHLGEFKDITSDTDEQALNLKEVIKMMIENKEIDGKDFFIKDEKDEKSGDECSFYLHVENYGSTKKLEVDMNYKVILNGESSTINHYKIPKNDFIGDVITQLIHRKCTHL